MTTENSPEAKARAAVMDMLFIAYGHGAPFTGDQCRAALDRLCTLMRTQGAMEMGDKLHAHFCWTGPFEEYMQQAEAEYAAACAAVEAG